MKDLKMENEISYAVLELGGRDFFDYLLRPMATPEIITVFIKQFFVGESSRLVGETIDFSSMKDVVADCKISNSFLVIG